MRPCWTWFEEPAGQGGDEPPSWRGANRPERRSLKSSTHRGKTRQQPSTARFAPSVAPSTFSSVHRPLSRRDENTLAVNGCIGDPTASARELTLPSLFGKRTPEPGGQCTGPRKHRRRSAAETRHGRRAEMGRALATLVRTAERRRDCVGGTCSRRAFEHQIFSMPHSEAVAITNPTARRSLQNQWAGSSASVPPSCCSERSVECGANGSPVWVAAGVAVALVLFMAEYRAAGRLTMRLVPKR